MSNKFVITFILLSLFLSSCGGGGKINPGDQYTAPLQLNSSLTNVQIQNNQLVLVLIILVPMVTIELLVYMMAQQQRLHLIFPSELKAMHMINHMFMWLFSETDSN